MWPSESRCPTGRSPRDGLGWRGAAGPDPGFSLHRGQGWLLGVATGSVLLKTSCITVPWLFPSR